MDKEASSRTVTAKITKDSKDEDSHLAKLLERKMNPKVVKQSSFDNSCLDLLDPSNYTSAVELRIGHVRLFDLRKRSDSSRPTITTHNKIP